ncbi:MAG: DNA polymerase I [Acidimicrobiia bacterium]|nr:DNA polymerase I [Acidimicrobiia bacterium]
MPTIALLDGHSLAYRAFYALPADLATSAGQVTNAVFGFTSMLIKLLGDENPEALVVAWDVRGPTFRSERYPEYKAQREKAPDLFSSQLPLIREVLDSLKIRQVGVSGVEADDVIATLATSSKRDGWDVVVVTGDRDSFQLIEPGIRVFYTKRGISDTVDATHHWVEERYGIPATSYVEYAALRGDPSDNLPGVAGVGEKTAAKLLTNYGSLEGIYDHLDEMTPKLRENLEASREQVFLNRELMKLVRDVELEVDDPAEFTRQPWDHATVLEVFDGLAFRTLWERLNELGETGGATPGAGGGEVLDVEVVTVTDPEAITALGTGRMTIEPVWEGEQLIGVVVAGPGEICSHVAVDKLDALAGALADPSVPKVLHDAKPFVSAILQRGLEFDGLEMDTALAAYLINPAQRSADLVDLASRELGLEVDSVDRTEEATASQGAFDFDATGPDLEGAARRAVAVQRLTERLTEQVEARGEIDLMSEVELPLVPILAAMEHRGIGADREYLLELREDLRARLADLESEIYEAAGEPFNINSTLQLREVLFERLELPILKKTPKGVPSTDASVLEQLVDKHPMVGHLLSYRELEKLRSTYVDGLLPLIESDGRIHGRFNQMAAATGRLSSERPNLQNIPIRSEEGRAIRRAFVAAEGMHFVVADYSQIELRILAHLSGDEGLLTAFRNDEDIHQATAARVFDIDAADVTNDQRRTAKVINFGLLYGMEAFGLAQRLEIGRDEAQAHVDAYFKQFPDVQEFMQGIVGEAKSTGYTTTLLGRRRYLPELASSNFRNRQMGERMALNAPIQGSAADIIKKAMVVLEPQLADLGAQMLLQIHDELVLEAPLDRIDDTLTLITDVMESVVELAVPLRVDVASGRSLADCKS